MLTKYIPIYLETFFCSFGTTCIADFLDLLKSLQNLKERFVFITGVYDICGMLFE